ncbi:CRT10-domain-containing protein [Madurella fahalii]|uniref:CRT10-domain-containing protein n=1 Tax=Madurella fahalii TaxID=1157608 RepID=A0ABQ0FX51_9PEZI
MDSKADAQAGYSEIYVGPTCHVQTATSRFGPDAVEEIKAWVFQGPQMNEMGSDEEDDEDEDESDDEYDNEDEADVEVYEALDGQATTTTASSGPEADHSFPPRVAASRCNLTTLSQRYNLYFAAYQDRVYVFQPQRAPRILPPPSLILHPRPSKLAVLYGGYIDPAFGHQINHIIVGNLGNLEIVLFAYDDGDVTAYYTHAIARCIAANSDHGHAPGRGHSRAAHPKPFFHDNVGKSAWGLGVHERSRLIAVGSNLHEVTVFAFAVSDNKVTIRSPEADHSPSVLNDQTALELQRHFQSRTRTWRITLPLGPQGNNIPNLAFVDDEAGEADKVVAVDIYGNAWLLDIWKIGAVPVHWPDYPVRDRMQGSRGWGVVVLPDNSFKPTKTVGDALGLPGNEIVSMRAGWLETTCSLYYIKDLAPDAGSVLMHRAQYDYAGVHSGKKKGDSILDDDFNVWETTSESEDELEDTAMAMVLEQAAVSLTQSTVSGTWSGKLPVVEPLCDAAVSRIEVTAGAQLSRSIIPSFGEVRRLDGNTSLHMEFSRLHGERQRRTKAIDFGKAELPAHLVKGACLLRTSLMDIELQPFDHTETSIVCKYVLTSHNRPGVSTPLELHPHYSERVNMIIHVPELNLVVAGSPVGRVALITPTKTAGRFQHIRVRRGFRVERVLPRRSEDALRPACTLIGIAMSPVPNDRARRLNLHPPRGSTPPIMYRLMLHYRDHTILMYDISRGLGDGDLMIF